MLYGMHMCTRTRARAHTQTHMHSPTFTAYTVNKRIHLRAREHTHTHTPTYLQLHTPHTYAVFRELPLWRVYETRTLREHYRAWDEVIAHGTRMADESSPGFNDFADGVENFIEHIKVCMNAAVNYFSLACTPLFAPTQYLLC